MPFRLIYEVDMENTHDWLSRLLEMIPVRGALDYRCFPRRLGASTFAASQLGEISYHVILGGSAVLEDPEAGPTRKLVAGDVLLFPHGSAHALHDGSDAAPAHAPSDPGSTSFFTRMTGPEIGSTCCAATSFFRPRMSV